MTAAARLFLLITALTGWGAYLGLRDSGDTGPTLVLAGTCITR